MSACWKEAFSLCENAKYFIPTNKNDARTSFINILMDFSVHQQDFFQCETTAQTCTAVPEVHILYVQSVHSINIWIQWPITGDTPCVGRQDSAGDVLWIVWP